MFSTNAATWSVGVQARCLDAVIADKDNSRFLVGTCSLKVSNQLQVLRHEAASNEIQCTHSFQHDQEIRQVLSSPHESTHVLLCSKRLNTAKTNCALYALPITSVSESESTVASESDAQPTQPLEQLAALPQQATKAAWHPTVQESSEPQIASCHGTQIATWALHNDTFQLKATMEHKTDKPHHFVNALKWDPHHTQYLTSAVGPNLVTWDIRSSRQAFAIDRAHLASALDVDYNPNRPFSLVSGGDDGKMRFWDLRHAKRALLSLNAHSHWVACVVYNRFHDQLVLSGGTDSMVCLWRASSISSAPIVELSDQELMDDPSLPSSGGDVIDTRIRSFEEHQDSVYAIAWGASDSWNFASLSYDGRFVMNAVPSTEKYKILL